MNHIQDVCGNTTAIQRLLNTILIECLCLPNFHKITEKNHNPEINAVYMRQHSQIWGCEQNDFIFHYILLITIYYRVIVVIAFISLFIIRNCNAESKLLQPCSTWFIMELRTKNRNRSI